MRTRIELIFVCVLLCLGLLVNFGTSWGGSADDNDENKDFGLFLIGAPVFKDLTEIQATVRVNCYLGRSITVNEDRILQLTEDKLRLSGFKVWLDSDFDLTDESPSQILKRLSIPTLTIDVSYGTSQIKNWGIDTWAIGTVSIDLEENVIIQRNGYKTRVSTFHTESPIVQRGLNAGNFETEIERQVNQFFSVQWNPCLLSYRDNWDEHGILFEHFDVPTD